MTGFLGPEGLLFDGTNVWVTDQNKLRRLDANGAILQTVDLTYPGHQPVFDGANIWVPESDGVLSSVKVVRAATGEILATLPMPDLADSSVRTAAFDGRRVLVTDYISNRVYLWNASDLSYLGTIDFLFPNSSPFGACSDGHAFWVACRAGELARVE